MSEILLTHLGTIFSFDVPLLLAESDLLETTSDTKRIIGLEPNQQNYRLLVVEDKWENRQILVKLLSSVGFEVREAINGQEAFVLWSSWKPHLIWINMQMPVMDGYEVAPKLKATDKRKVTVIIALTANAFEEQREAILRAGGDDFLVNTFCLEQVINLTKSATS